MTPTAGSTNPSKAQTDRRPDFFAGFDLAAEILSTVPASTLGSRTPCPGYDVATLVSHLVGAANRAAALGRGVVEGGESQFPDIELSDSAELIRLAKKEAQRAWADDSRLTATTTMPWGETYEGYTLVDMYLAELAAHSWDLAAATGRLARLEELGSQLAGPALQGARSMLKPEYRNAMGEGNPFGSEVTVPAQSTEWDRFAGFMGRDPKWS